MWKQRKFIYFELFHLSLSLLFAIRDKNALLQRKEKWRDHDVAEIINDNFSHLFFFLFIIAVPNVSFHVYAPGFFARFFESHAVMLQGNAGLKPKEGEVTSRPWQWPINFKVSFYTYFFRPFFEGIFYKIKFLNTCPKPPKKSNIFQ